MKTKILLVALTISALAWQSKKQKRIIFFGDSITQMGAKQGGYIWMMQQTLDQKKLNEKYELIGAGIGGNKIYDLYLRMPEDVLAKNPDAVVIYIGVNDVWHKTTSGTGTDKDKFEKFYRAVIKKLKDQNIETILATPAGIGELKNNANPQDKDLDTYSDVIRKLATENNCKLVDLRAQWKEYNEANNTTNQEKGMLSTDRVHLNETGNKLVADAMMKALSIE